MGIHVSGINMPKGSNMMLLISPDGDVWEMGDLLGDDKYLDGVKAVPIPKHGRLIDADALLRVIHDAYEARDAEQNAIMDKVSMLVVAAPTIIPADPAEERA